MDSCIVEFLVLYKKVFSPIAKQLSKTGLHKVKFHSPKHATFYIHRYGSHDNFFGGNLESALKSTVKAPTKFTSRSHDHIARDLASQQHERFVCHASCTEIANSMDHSLNIKAIVDSTHPRSRMRIADDSYLIATKKPMDWELHTPVFYLFCQGNGNWSTHLHSHMHMNLLVYPNFMIKVYTDIFLSEEQQYVIKVAKNTHVHGFQCVDCSCGATIPSLHAQECNVLCCHPSFHSYPYLRHPWYDWIMVKWLVDDDPMVNKYILVATHLLLFAPLSDKKTTQKHL